MFKIGDKVIRVLGEDSKNGMHLNQIYTVHRIANTWLIFKNAHGSWNPKNFKLVERKEENMSKKVITRSEVENAVQLRQFIVGSVSQCGVVSVASNPSTHETEALAYNEAKRLAQTDQTKTFIVLQFKRGAKVAQIVEI